LSIINVDMLGFESRLHDPLDGIPVIPRNWRADPSQRRPMGEGGIMTCKE
jgi:hypothetical protein